MRPELPPLDRYAELLREIWDSRMLSNFAAMAQRFERGAQEYLGTPRVRCVASGDIGLIVALRALDLPHASEAIVPSFTFNSTVNAVRWNGLVPVFVDIDPETLTLDPDDVAQAMTKRTSVIIGTHVFGNPCDADRLRQAARGLPVVYDAAHGFGSRYRDRPVGRLGDLEVFSFSGTKLVTSGEGGLVTAATDALVSKVEYGRAYGFQNDYDSQFVGINGKLSELNAALGVLTIETVERVVARRNALVARYRERLGDVAGIAFQKVDPRDRSTFKDFAVLFPTGAARDAAEARLTAADVQTKRYFRPCHTMRAFRQWAKRRLPVTEDVYARILCLPMFNELTERELDQVARLVH